MKVKNYLSAALSLFILGCNNSSSNNSGSTDSVQVIKDSNQAKMDTSKTTTDTSRIAASVSDADAKFAVEATYAGMMEVELGKVAGQNAENKEVKDFGAMMVKDHTESGDKLKSIVITKHISLPLDVSRDDQEKINALKKKTGTDFDKAYIEMMISGHKKVASMFEDEIKKGSDTDIRDFATHTLDVIHMHLNAAKKIEAEIKR
jgi:putative membrane protein